MFALALSRLKLFSGPGQDDRFPLGDEVPDVTAVHLAWSWSGTPLPQADMNDVLRFFGPRNLRGNVAPLVIPVPAWRAVRAAVRGDGRSGGRAAFGFWSDQIGSCRRFVRRGACGRAARVRVSPLAVVLSGFERSFCREARPRIMVMLIT